MSDDLEPNEDTTPENPNIRQLREKAKRVDEADARAQAAERELAFAKAGVDLSDSRTGYFVRGYNGELDPQAIKDAAERDGFLKATAPEQKGVAQDEQDALERVRQATEGGTEPPPPDPAADFNEVYATAIRENWHPDQLTEALAKKAYEMGLPTARDGQEYVPINQF